jgi:ketosteroid isomerase-like protein
MASHQLHTKPRGARIQRELHGELQDFLNQLAEAVTRGDGEAVAKLYEVPALVIGIDGVMPVTSLDEIAKFFGGAKEMYNARGITNTRADIVDEEWIGDRLVVVKVRWPYLDEEGHEVGAEASDYTLRRDDAGQLKVRSILMRGVEGTGGDKPS